MKKKIFVILLVLFMLPACQTSTEPDVAKVDATAVPTTTVTKAASTETPTATSTLMPTQTPKPTNTPTAVPPTATPKPTAESTATASLPMPTANESTPLSEPFSPIYLVTTTQLDQFSEDFGIIGWELEAEIEWENRLCRTFLGMSWSINPNIAINCIFRADPMPEIDVIRQWLFDNEFLYSTAVALEPSYTYENESLLYMDRLDNGHAVYDAFLVGDGVVYWTSISLGVQLGDTPEEIFQKHGDFIEAFLNNIFLVNLGK